MKTVRLMNEPALYQIQVQGRLPDTWHEMFGGLRAQIEGEGQVITTLTGCLSDQAALNGILQALYGLGLALLSVRRLEPDPPAESNQRETTR
jgi:hypothetical protein